MSRLNDAQPMLRRLARVWSMLLSGSVAAQVLNLAAFAIAARVLPLEVLGGLAIIQGTSRLINEAINIRSGPTLTAYGARFLAVDDRNGYAGLLKAGLSLDAATAFLAALIAALALHFFANVIGVPAALATWAPIYALLVLVTIPGLHQAVLPAMNSYVDISVSSVISAVIRLCASAACAFLEAGPIWFLFVWLLADVLQQVLPMAYALRALRRRGYPSIFSAAARPTIAGLPGFWGSIWKTNIATSIRGLSENGDMALVGWLAGPSTAGVLRIAKACAGPVLHLGHPITLAAFPEMTRLFAEGARAKFYRDGLIYCLFGGALGLCCLAGAAILGPFVVDLVAGAGNQVAVPVFVAMTAAYGLALCAMVFLPMAAAQERMMGYLLATAASTAVFAAVAVPSVAAWGALGVGAAAIAQHGVFAVAAGAVVFAGRRSA